jgi:hypothetical protein
MSWRYDFALAMMGYIHLATDIFVSNYLRGGREQIIASSRRCIDIWRALSEVERSVERGDIGAWISSTS